MKKFCIILIILCMLPVALASTIDKEVFDALDSEDEVKVIVFLKDPVDFSASSVEEVKANLHKKIEKIGQVQEKSLKKVEKSFKLKQQYKTIPAFSGEADAETITAFQDDPAVERVVLDKVFSVSLDASGPLINSTRANNLTFDYKYNLTGSGQTVCVIDTGIDYNHTNLGGGWGNRVIGGWDFVNNDADPMDDNGHGTHVAGIVASNHATYTGVAPDANLMALKVCDAAGDCYGSYMLSAIDWCNTNASAYNISVITLSIGDSAQHNASDCPTTFDAAINASFALGIVTTIASGNEGFNAGINSPACSPNAISVGATDKTDVIANGYSNTASILDILAPGSSIVSLAVGGGTTTKTGTSMATPHAAGAAALLFEFGKRELNRNLTPAEILNTLKATGVNKTDSDNGLSFPRIDVFAAVTSLDNVSPNASYADPTPANGSANLSEATFLVNVSERLENATVNISGTSYAMVLNSTDVLYSLDVGCLPNGSATFSISGSDYAGNNFSLGERVFTGNNSEPIINNVTPNITQINTSENQTVSFNQSAADPNNHSLSFSWFLDDVLQSQNQSFNYTPSFNESGNHTVSITVSDCFLNTSTEWNVSVSDVNRAPTGSITSPANESTINEFGSAITFTTNATDPDGDNLTILWSFGDGNSSNNTNTSYTYNSTGNYTVILNVSDGDFNITDSINISVVDTTAPTIESTSLTNKTSLPAGTTSKVIILTTDQIALCKYNTTDTVWENMTIMNGTNSTSHNITATGLSNGNTFNYYFLCEDSTGNRMNTTYGLQFSVSSPAEPTPTTTTSSSSSGGGGGGTPISLSTATTDAKVISSKTHFFSKAQAGQSYSMDLREDSEIPLNEIIFTPSQTLPIVSLSVYVFDKNPIENKSDNAFSYLEVSIDGATSESISSASIDFFVSKEWLSSNNLDPDSVGLYRFVSDTWIRLSTKKTLELATQYSYTATSPGFSFFSIQADRTLAAPEPIPALESPGPSGFSVSDESLGTEAPVTIEEPKADGPLLKKTVINVGVAVFLLLIIAVLLQHLNAPGEKKKRRKKKGLMKIKGNKDSNKLSSLEKKERPINPTKPSKYYQKYFKFYSVHYEDIDKDQTRSSSSRKVSNADMENSSSGTVRKNS